LAEPFYFRAISLCGSYQGGNHACIAVVGGACSYLCRRWRVFDGAFVLIKLLNNWPESFAEFGTFLFAQQASRRLARPKSIAAP
jgi:hypothetical protein